MDKFKKIIVYVLFVAMIGVATFGWAGEVGAQDVTFGGTKSGASAYSMGQTKAQQLQSAVDSANSKLQEASASGNDVAAATAAKELDTAQTALNNYNNSQSSTSNDETYACGLTTFWSNMGSCIMDATSYIFEAAILPVFARIFEWSATLLDYTLTLSVGTTQSDTIFTKASDAISTGWTTMRDLVNIFFIFILLYVSISTILQTAGHTAKDMLRKIIIAALLVNFSLFFTRLAIDAGNYLAVGLYNKTSQITGTSISSYFVDKSQFGKFYDKNPNVNQEAGAKLLSNTTPRLISAVSRTILVFLLIWVFIMVAIIFIARAIILLFLMILSPIGFVGGLLPITEQYSKQWRDELLNQVLVAPIFYLFLYMIVLIMQSFASNPLATASAATDNESLNTSLNLITSFAIVFGLIYIAAKATKKFSGAFGEAIGGVIKSGIGLAVGAATGGASLALRGTVGRAGSYATMSDEELNKAAAGGSRIAKMTLAMKKTGASGGITGSLSTLALKGGKGLSKSTFDARNSTAFGKVAGFADSMTGGDLKKMELGSKGKLIGTQKGGYEQFAKDKQKVEEERLDLIGGKKHNDDDVKKAQATLEGFRNSEEFKTNLLKNSTRKNQYDQATSNNSDAKNELARLKKEEEFAKATGNSVQLATVQSEIKTTMKKLDDSDKVLGQVSKEVGEEMIASGEGANDDVVKAMSTLDEDEKRSSYLSQLKQDSMTKTVLKSMAVGAGTGAVAGTVVPGIGNVVGAITGGIAGAIKGAMGTTKGENAMIADRLRAGKKVQAGAEAELSKIKKVLKEAGVDIGEEKKEEGKK